MKILYEPQDLSAGMYFVPEKDLPKNKGVLTKDQKSFIISVAYQLGYMHAPKGEYTWTISSVADGWTQTFTNYDDVLKRINGNGYVEVKRAFIAKCMNY